jgi:hypothetical protein
VAGQFAAAVSLSGITNEYRFDEGTGTSAADSVGGNNATLQNFGVGNAQWVKGMFGGGVKYTDDNSYVITNSALSTGSASQFSVSFWSRLDSRPNSNDMALGTPQLDNWITYNPSGNTNGSGKHGIGIGSVRDPNDPLFSVWENYVVTYDRPSSTATVYRDGVLSDSGTVALPSLNTQWVFGHNQGPGNPNGSYKGALDEIQFYNRVLSPAEVSTLAARPPQPGVTARLVTPAHDFGSQPVGQFATASITFFVVPGLNDWIAWNRFPDLRVVNDTGTRYLGTYTTEVDDFFNLTITNPLGQQLTVSMDQNGSLGEPTGPQSVIYGSASAAPDVVRADNFFAPSTFNEAGAFNSIFTTAGFYKFDFSFRNIGGPAHYPNIYLLTHLVPEPTTLGLMWVAGSAIVVATRRIRLRQSCRQIP